LESANESLAKLSAEKQSAVNELSRLQQANAELQAELEWERQKEQRVVKVAVTNLDSGEQTSELVVELRDEVDSLNHAVKMLAAKRKTDVQKIRTLRDTGNTKRKDKKNCC
jgi:chromosome segregation ATPase